jgi:Transposase and inactivated derivatives
MRKTTKHTVHSLEAKNQIVQEYLKGISGCSELMRKYDIASRSVFHRWVKQYRENGSALDSRGKNNPNAGKYPRKKLNPEEMSREELIEYVKATEDIKKLKVFLNKQKKNIK